MRARPTIRHPRGVVVFEIYNDDFNLTEWLLTSTDSGARAFMESKWKARSALQKTIITPTVAFVFIDLNVNSERNGGCVLRMKLNGESLGSNSRDLYCDKGRDGCNKQSYARRYALSHSKWPTKPSLGCPIEQSIHGFVEHIESLHDCESIGFGNVTHFATAWRKTMKLFIFVQHVL